MSAFRNYYGGRFLTLDDARVLQKHWDKVSQMRKAIGDTPLPKKHFGRFFWIRGDNGNDLGIFDPFLMKMVSDRASGYTVILKR